MNTLPMINEIKELEMNTITKNPRSKPLNQTPRYLQRAIQV